MVTFYLKWENINFKSTVKVTYACWNLRTTAIYKEIYLVKLHRQNEILRKNSQIIKKKTGKGNQRNEEKGEQNRL